MPTDFSILASMPNAPANFPRKEVRTYIKDGGRVSMVTEPESEIDYQVRWRIELANRLQRVNLK